MIWFARVHKPEWQGQPLLLNNTTGALAQPGPESAHWYESTEQSGHMPHGKHQRM